MQLYPRVDGKPDFVAIEERVLARWAEEDTFARSVEKRAGGDNEYVFYDGPPFANGLPHYGHLLTGYVKDVIPRYQTMRGRRVERRFGWDCHGLPPEMEAEKELGLSGRKSIQEYGVAEFNDHCRSSVMRYTAEWERYVGRQARWVDFANDYKTMDISYMESVIWAFKQLWEKGLIYEAYRVMPYSWGAQTPLSNFEIRLDDATRSRQDPAVTVAFELEEQQGDPGPLRLLAWTTTPWTLPSNLALAVHPEMHYDIWYVGGEAAAGAPAVPEGYYAMASETSERTMAQRQGETAHKIATLKGSDFIEREYKPLFDFFAETPGAFKVLAGDFVTAEEGTGIVHMAPGFGEDDQQVCEAAGIAVVVPVNDEGSFTSEVHMWEGQNVFEANSAIISELRSRGALFRHDSIEHSYPYCWRTDTPIIYRAMNSWYVEVTAIRDRMVELNQQINWIPGHVRDGRFGKWLEGARDWSISRNRFWGAPIPVWRSDNPDFPRVDVYGSLDEIATDFGIRPADLHRPSIDELVRPNPDDPSGKSQMRRVPEVLDCWFESGSMPYAQVHYPFENRERFEAHFPADFIVEYVNQTRGWFYTLHVLATALFDSPPFRNAIGHGVLLAADGAKLSKRLKNYPDPEYIFSTQGADALRWYLMASPTMRGGSLCINEEDMKAVTRLLLYPVWNAYSFFCLYANADGVKAEHDTSSQHVLDRYILAKTRQLVESVTSSLDAYDLADACAQVEEFIDALNNWYIRRSRDRFWAPKVSMEGGETNRAAAAEKQQAYNTLYTALITLVKTLAPLLPLITEEIYMGLTGNESVHLASWPDPEDLSGDEKLVAQMDLAREVCSTALRMREQAKVPVRIPLKQMIVAGAGVEKLEGPKLKDTAGSPDGDSGVAQLISEELNVKDLVFESEMPEGFSPVLRPNGKLLGPRLKDRMQAVFTAAKKGDWEVLPDGTAQVGGEKLEADEFALAIEQPESTEKSGGSAVLRDAATVIVLDTEVTPELHREGVARHVVRIVQQGRRNSGLDVSDRIRLFLDLEADMEEAVREHEGFVSEQVLAVEIFYSVEGCDGVEKSEDGRVLYCIEKL